MSWILFVFAIGGCWLSHEVPGDPGGRDGGRRDAGRRDAGGIDAGRRDAGDGACRPFEMTTLCTEGPTSPFLAVGRPSTILLHTDACHCRGELRCSSRIATQAGPDTRGVIQLFTDLCNEGRCAACTGPNEIACEIDALEPGDYDLYVNGNPTFHVQSSRSGTTPPSRLCQEAGSIGGGLCDFPGEGTAWRPEQVCFETVPASDELVFELSAETSCAFEPGPCDLTIEEAAGGRITIHPRIRGCDEGSPTWDCSGMSGLLTKTCSALTVAPGRYVLALDDGTAVGAIDVGAGGVSRRECVAVP